MDNERQEVNERQMILKMLEAGKITAAEAAELLKALAGGERRGHGIHVHDAPRHGVRGPDWHEFHGPRHVGRAMRGFFRDIADTVRAEVEGLPHWWPGNYHEFEDEVRGDFGAGTAEARVSVYTANGSVVVRDWEEPGWKVRLTKRVRAGDRAAAEARAKSMGRVTGGNGALEVEGERGWTGLASMAVEVFLPRGRQYQARVRTANGGVSVGALDFSVMEARTANGRIKLDGATGDILDLETCNGGVEARCGARRLDATTRNGSLGLEVMPGRPGDYRLRSLNGAIVARLPAGPDVAYDVEGETMLGHVDVNLPDVETARDERGVVRRHVRAHSRGGDAANKFVVRAHTNSGSVEFRA